MALKEYKRRDEFMDRVLSGDPPSIISSELSLTHEEIKHLYQDTFYNRDYRPYSPRMWRGGKPFTELEKRMLRRYKERNFPIAIQALILQRKPDEISKDEAGKAVILRFKEVACTTDILLAHHYLFHVAGRPIISWQAFELSKKEEIEFGGGTELLRILDKSEHRAVDYPAHIRGLAFYMLYKHMEKTGKWNENAIPYAWTPENKKA